MFKPLLLAFLVAACGGSSKPAPTTPPPEPPTEPVATEPAQPTEPATPAAPAEPDPEQVKAELVAAETDAFESARPVLDKHCARCHAKGAKQANAKKLGGFDMTAYPFGGKHAAEIGEEIRKVLGIGGGKVTMPADKKGAVKGDELALIGAWADAFEAARKGGAHEGRGGK